MKTKVSLFSVYFRRGTVQKIDNVHLHRAKMKCNNMMSFSQGLL